MKTKFLALIIGLLLFFGISFADISIEIPTLSPSQIVNGLNGQASISDIYTAITPNYTDHYFWLNISGPVASSQITRSQIKPFGLGIDVLNASLFSVSSTTFIQNTTMNSPYINISWDGKTGLQYIDNYSTILSNMTNFSINKTPVSLGDGQKILFVRTPNWQSGEYNFTASIVNIDPVIAACGSIIVSGAYTISLPLTGVGAGSAACINVTATDVSIDGQGNTITGAGVASTYGIYVQANDVNISNTIISNYSDSIQYFKASNGNITNVSSFNSTSTAFQFFSANSIVIYKNFINNTAASGISFNNDANNTTITNNTVYNVADGIEMVGQAGRTNYTLINNNSFINSTSDVIFLDPDTNSIIANNTLVYTGSGNAINLNLALTNNNSVFSNNISGTAGIGVTVTSSTGNNITKNAIIMTTGTGVTLTSCVNTTIVTNSINITTGDGIDILTKTNSTNIINNTINTTGNTAPDIKVNVGSNGTIANNTIYSKGTSSFGIELQATAQNWTIQNNSVYTIGNTAPAVYLAASTSNRTLITLNNITTTGTGNPINITSTAPQAGNNNITNNTLNASNTRASLLIGFGSGNNSIYYNNFTSGKYFINDTNGSDFFNTTVGGFAEGNFYANISLYALTSSTNNGWADGGANYPANATNTPGIFTSDSLGNDNGPWIGISSGSTIIGMVGTALSWTWQTVVAGNQIPQYSGLGWTWGTYSSGSGVLTPNGTALMWNLIGQ